MAVYERLLAIVGLVGGIALTAATFLPKGDMVEAVGASACFALAGSMIFQSKGLHKAGPS